MTWLSILDDTPVVPQKRPENSMHLISDTNAGPEIINWATPPAEFPMGSYLLRVEAYRKNSSLHYAFDHRRIFIDR